MEFTQKCGYCVYQVTPDDTPRTQCGNFEIQVTGTELTVWVWPWKVVKTIENHWWLNIIGEHMIVPQLVG